MRTLTFLATLLVVSVTQSFSQATTVKEKKLAKSVDSLILTITTPFSGNVLAAVNGHVILTKSYGLANFETKAPLNDASLFDLASVSKQFTAMCVMILSEKGKLRYDDDVQKYLPQLPYAGVTLRNLLNHTSGIPDYNEYVGNFGKYFGPQKRVLHNDDIVDLLAREKPALLFKPGEKFSYSNSGYVILASVVMKVSGMSFDNFLKTNIFKPLHMDRTRLYDTRREKGEKIDNYAYGYVYSDSLRKFILPDDHPRWAKYVYHMDGICGDGGLNSTTLDTYSWWQGLSSNLLVKKETQNEAYTPATLTSGEKTVSGFGWFIETKPSVGTIIYHSGGHPGYGTYIIQFPELNGVFIVLSNNSGRGSKGVIDQVINFYGKAK